jgi:hypothetical protein
MTAKHFFTTKSVYPGLRFHPLSKGHSLAEAAVSILGWDVRGAGILMDQARDLQKQGRDAVAKDSFVERLRDAADILRAHINECGEVLQPLRQAARALRPVTETVRVAGSNFASALDALIAAADLAERRLLAATEALGQVPPAPVNALCPSLAEVEEDADLMLAQALKEVAHAEKPPALTWTRPMTVQDMAKLFKISPNKMAKKLKEGFPRSQKLNRQSYRLAVEDLEDWVIDRLS